MKAGFVGNVRKSGRNFSEGHVRTDEERQEREVCEVKTGTSRGLLMQK